MDSDYVDNKTPTTQNASIRTCGSICTRCDVATETGGARNTAVRCGASGIDGDESNIDDEDDETASLEKLKYDEAPPPPPRLSRWTSDDVVVVAMCVSDERGDGDGAIDAR